MAAKKFIIEWIASVVCTTPGVPTGCGGQPLYYKVYVGNQSGVYSQTFNAPGGSPFTTPRELDTSAPLYFAVSAVNSAGEGPKSSEAVYIEAVPTPTPIAKPVAPTGVAARPAP